MDEAINTLQIDKRTRVSVYYDDMPDDPCNCSDGISVHALEMDTHYYPPPCGDDTQRTAISAIYENNDDYKTPLKKHFDRIGTIYEIVDLYTDREWIGKFVFYIEPGKIEEIGAENAKRYLLHIIEKYKQYCMGYVYTVTFEKLETWRNSRGDKRQTWEVRDSICGVYEDVFDDKTLWSIAKEYFGVKTKKAM